MWDRLRSLDPPHLLLVGFVVVVAVSLLLAASTSAVALGPYNPNWEGASELQGVAESTGTSSQVILNTTAYATADPPRTVAVVLSPERSYDPDEAERIRRFVRDGGTLLVAEDFGARGNELLAAVGASARFDGRLLRDEVYYYRSPALLEARNASRTAVSRPTTQVTLNYGTAVDPGDATVAVRTSPFAYPDGNENGELDRNESIGSYPVVTVESVGEGQVVAVGDPSLFINAMLDRPGNRRFAERLLGAHDSVLLDYSHSGQPPPLSYLVLVLRRSPLLQVLVAGGTVGAVLLWFRRPFDGDSLGSLVGGNRRGSGARDRTRLESTLRTRRPDWEESRVRSVVDALVSERAAGSTEPASPPAAEGDVENGRSES